MIERVEQIKKLAEELLQQESGERESVRIRADAGMVLPVFLGRSFPTGSFVATIPDVSSDWIPVNYRKPSLRGLIVHWAGLDGRAGGKFNIVLELSNESALDIFVLFIARICEDIEQAEGRRNAVHRVLAQVDRWRNFFSGSSEGALSEQRQTGLYGELSQLEALCDAGIGTAIVFNAWTGSRATNQDFEFGPVAIEVKSTTAAATSTVAISNIRQLDPTGLEDLFLLRVAFDARQGGKHTLPALIQSLRKRVEREAAPQQIQFEENLIRSGYRDKHAEVYAQRSYTVRFRDQYCVRGEFPRLEESRIPPGVSEVRYAADLSGCEAYKVAFDQIVDRIGAGKNHG
jgi:hypothetical protein